MPESQLEYFRRLTREKLIPLVVRELASVEDLPDAPKKWECGWCGRTTLVSKAPSPQMALHTTYCELRQAATVWE